MMRIGLSGTNWTGKSTTISSLQDRLTDRDLDVVSLSQIGSRCPYPMQMEQTLDASRWMVREVQARIDGAHPDQIQIFDRSPIDILAFTMLAGDRAGSDGDAEPILQQILGMVRSFDCLFFIDLPCPEEWPPPQVIATPSKTAAALLANRYMQVAIKKNGLTMNLLPWSIEERVDAILAIIR